MKDNAAENKRLISALRQLDHLQRPNVWQEAQPKSLAESTEARRAGNEIYTKQPHDDAAHVEALVCYSRSIAFGLADSEELGLAYGNRSALLFHLKRYRDCLRDLERALELPTDELRKVKYLCRKVDCEAELGMPEARETCEIAKDLLQQLDASVNLKKNMVMKLVEAIVKLESQGPLLESKTRLEPNYPKRSSEEQADASDGLAISRNRRKTRLGRFLSATRDLVTGETLYCGGAYAAVPTMTHIHSHCSHCLAFAWSGRPCPDCSQAMYCTEKCRAEARELYHDVECRIIDRAWAHVRPGNTGRLLSVRLLLMALREAGGLKELRDSLENVDACDDPIRRGFTEDAFVSNHKSVYSLATNDYKKDVEDLEAVSNDSVVLLHLLANHTRVFSKYFDGDKNALARSDDALFVGRLLSHLHHVVLVNAITVKDINNISMTDWTWSTPKEENCTGSYIIPYLSLLNHSCFPNAAKCETGDGRTILYALRPIGAGEQVLRSYGPMYYDTLKMDRTKLIKRFQFTCDCIACESDWPMFMNMISSEFTYPALSPGEVNAIVKAHDKTDQLYESLKNDNDEYNVDTLQEVAYAVTLTIKYCKLPNWRFAKLTAMLISIYNNVYGYVIGIPNIC